MTAWIEGTRPLPLIVENVPAALRERPQWVVWRLEKNEKGELTKPPYCARAPHCKASTTNSATWGTFEEAVRAYEAGRADGIGYVLTEEDPFVGLDLDDVDEETARAVLDLVPTYCERSPSGRGYRLIARGEKPTDNCKKGRFEIYDTRRYLTITGHRLEGAPEDVQDVARHRLLAYAHRYVEGDEDLLQRARQAEGGERFTALFDRGDWHGSGYPSQSEADLALCSMLAFWCKGDRDRIDRLFRRSKLMRAKWEERRGSTTYGEQTIEKALESLPEHRGRHRTRDASRERPRESAPTRLCKLAKDRFRFIRDVDGTPYLVGDDGIALPLRGAGRSALARAFYEVEGQGLTASTLSEATPTLEAMALFEGEQERVHVRVARLDDRVYIDLGSAGVAVVEPGGWHVMPAALSSHKAQTTNRWPVFTRPPGFLDLPAPVRGGRLDELGAFVRAEGDGLLLTAAWLIGALGSPAGYPLLVLSGPQGSGKSTTARLLRALLDPQTGGLTAPPREVRDLVVTATNAHVVALDNLSTVPGWLSDALCRLATGGGLRTRALYTDRAEAIFEARRPIVINGIPDLVRYADLADRSIPVRLSMIPDGERETEADLWHRFEEARPRLLGALLDAVALGLARTGEVRPKRLPRMADFAAFVLAAEEALPGPAGRFLEAYAGAQEDLGATLLDDPLAQALLDFVDERGTWEGTATDLHAALLQHAGHERVPHGWPRTPAALGSMLSRLEPPLLAAGVEITRSRTERARTWCLTKKAGKMLSLLSLPSSNGPDGAKNRDSGMTATAVMPPSLPSSTPSLPSSDDSNHDGNDSNHDSNDGAAVMPKTARTGPKTAIHDSNDGNDGKFRDFLGDDEEVFELRPIRDSDPPF
ncbi:MAG: hypothetical protein KatS3mg043_1368 [Rhodothermaceae bacterium]|nr:MAG: hypothetical protein KatS3mg043_1368 [Rhodothermaceae bacterium]